MAYLLLSEYRTFLFLPKVSLLRAHLSNTDDTASMSTCADGVSECGWQHACAHLLQGLSAHQRLQQRPLQHLHQCSTAHTHTHLTPFTG